MAVNVVRHRHEGMVRWGVLEGDVVRPLAADHPSVRDVLRDAAAVLHGDAELLAPVPREHVQVLAPITRDRQVICQAVNYRSHMRESGLDPATSPFNVFFRKASSSLSSPQADIVCPERTDYLDHEVEIGLVLAADVDGPRTVTDAGLADHVAALVAFDDVSARDLQLADGQFYRSKSFRTFGPVGPHLTLVDAADLARFGELHLRLWVNGELRQDAYAAEMIHGPAATLTELSSVQDWEAGDLLATGTPGGCALRVPIAPLRAVAQVVSPLRRDAMVRRSASRNPRRLRIGDVVELHVGTDDGAIDLGRQRTAVVGA